MVPYIASFLQVYYIEIQIIISFCLYFTLILEFTHYLSSPLSILGCMDSFLMNLLSPSEILSADNTFLNNADTNYQYPK